ncbi:MAG: HAMP domain-containing histidine kinase [Candidatus Omnitrophica bacterium]|nr:HAMP domain-containing histidine kinase [Candidatus Omnitrophota bacterium]
MMNNRIRQKFISGLMVIFFTIGSIVPSYGQAFISQAGIMPSTPVTLSPTFNLPLLTGIKVYPDKPFRFDFIISRGAGNNDPERLTGVEGLQLKKESETLIKYFLASLTVPEKDLWVNLSPQEKSRIITKEFGETEMGRDLLAQDYILKQLTASLMSPDGEVGREFWDAVYLKIYENRRENIEDRQATKNKTTLSVASNLSSPVYHLSSGNLEVPTNILSKVWIIPEKAVILEKPPNSDQPNATAYIAEAKLKVMMEDDYFIEKRRENLEDRQTTKNKTASVGSNLSSSVYPLSSLIKKIIIPVLEKEVNEGKNFAQLRQVYHSLILAAWYKRKIKESLLSSIYVDKKKIQGINIIDPAMAEKIWTEYVETFKKGVFNFIKEEYDPVKQTIAPRKYFSGGLTMAMDAALLVRPLETNQTMLPLENLRREMVIETNFESVNQAQPTTDHAMVEELESLRQVKHEIDNLLTGWEGYWQILEQGKIIEREDGLTMAINARIEKINEFSLNIKYEVFNLSKSPDLNSADTQQCLTHLKEFLRETDYLSQEISVLVKIMALKNPALEQNKYFNDFSRLLESMNYAIHKLIAGDYDFERLEPALVDLNYVLHRDVNLIRSDAGIRVIENYAPDIKLIPLDEMKFFHVFMNLLKNAKEAMMSKGEITISTEKESNFVNIIVSDVGPGIPEEILPQVFDSGFTYEKINGNGFGLAICKKIVEAHGGTITVENIPGPSGSPAGARFIIRLPANVDAAMITSEAGLSPAHTTQLNMYPVTAGSLIENNPHKYIFVVNHNMGSERRGQVIRNVYRTMLNIFGNDNRLFPTPFWWMGWGGKKKALVIFQKLVTELVSNSHHAKDRDGNYEDVFFQLTTQNVAHQKYLSLEVWNNYMGIQNIPWAVKRQNTTGDTPGMGLPFIIDFLVYSFGGQVSIESEGVGYRFSSKRKVWGKDPNAISSKFSSTVNRGAKISILIPFALIDSAMINTEKVLQPTVFDLKKIIPTELHDKKVRIILMADNTGTLMDKYDRPMDDRIAEGLRALVDNTDNIIVVNSGDPKAAIEHAHRSVLLGAKKGAHLQYPLTWEGGTSIGTFNDDLKLEITDKIPDWKEPLRHELISNLAKIFYDQVEKLLNEGKLTERIPGLTLDKLEKDRERAKTVIDNKYLSGKGSIVSPGDEKNVAVYLLPEFFGKGGYIYDSGAKVALDVVDMLDKTKFLTLKHFKDIELKAFCMVGSLKNTTGPIKVYAGKNFLDISAVTKADSVRKIIYNSDIQKNSNEFVTLYVVMGDSGNDIPTINSEMGYQKSNGYNLSFFLSHSPEYAGDLNQNVFITESEHVNAAIQVLEWLNTFSGKTIAESGPFNALTWQTSSSDAAMTVKAVNGGIDLNSVNKILHTQNTEDAIRFHVDPAMRQYWHDSSGFVPVIINIFLLSNLRKFLEI